MDRCFAGRVTRATCKATVIVIVLFGGQVWSSRSCRVGLIERVGDRGRKLMMRIDFRRGEGREVQVS